VLVVVDVEVLVVVLVLVDVPTTCSSSSWSRFNEICRLLLPVVLVTIIGSSSLPKCKQSPSWKYLSSAAGFRSAITFPESR